MKIFVILSIFSSIVTCRNTRREQRFNKMQCDKLNKSLESNVDGSHYKLNAQFNTMCGDFYPKAKPVSPDNDARPIISFESFVRWMKTRFQTNNAINLRKLHVTE